MKKWFCLMLSALTALSLGGCGGQESPSGTSLTPVTLNEVAHSIFYAPQYVAIENGYFKDEGIDLTLVTGFGADKTATAVVSGEADIGFMGSESSIYIYNQNPDDYLVNFAQLTQRAGNFLVCPDSNSTTSNGTDLKGTYVYGGRAGGMPEMVFEFILKKNGIDPAVDLTIDQSIDFGSTAAAFTGNGSPADYTVEFEPSATALEQEGKGYVVASLGEASGYVPYTAYSAKQSYLSAHPDFCRPSPMHFRRVWITSRPIPRRKLQKSFSLSLQRPTLIPSQPSLPGIMSRIPGRKIWSLSRAALIFFKIF